MESHDFIEGVNAVIIEKHHNPQWKPSHHEEVSYLMPLLDPAHPRIPS